MHIKVTLNHFKAITVINQNKSLSFRKNCDFYAVKIAHKYFIRFKRTNFSKRQLMISLEEILTFLQWEAWKNLFIRDKEDKAIEHDENVWK